ncbi:MULTISPECIES: hypothetical protein [Nocardiaceae]|uniref:Helix-turn-helix domain-containing protein n=1 Tax=Rhodococcoides corynebacterioides TaxID=53972 RepID=A0ABS2KXU7_9NOCA|nr:MULTISPECIES: hypothetical protein [Rhodococcus]MBM7416756.1 hypothetical protein [Rhodococcus corynebacterioides]MBP1115009.1 hypothetical protein [Rhodococcus sp. PvP016]
MDFTAEAELSGALDDLDAAEIDSLASAVAPFRGRLTRSHLGRARLVVTLSADGVPQAVTLASALLRDLAGGRDLASLSVRSARDHESVSGLPPTDGWSSVSEVAAERAISRQAVLAQIAAGTLPAAKVGTTWVVARGARRFESGRFESGRYESGRFEKDW